MAKHTIKMQNIQFNPPNGEPVVIAVGDSVEWENAETEASRIQHDAVRLEEPTFATALLDPGKKSDPIVFNQATSSEGIEYFCTPHRNFMKGRIIVTLQGTNAAGYTRERALAAHSDHSKKR